jgi:CBS domain-containing protein
MVIKDIINKNVTTLAPDNTLYEAVKKAMDKGTNGMIVVDDDYKVVGMITSNTLIKACIPAYIKNNVQLASFGAPNLFVDSCDKAKDLLVKDIMKEDIPCLTEDMKVIEVAAKVMAPDFTRLPVIDKEGKLIGIVTRTQIRWAIARALKIA